ncbi:glucose dehydrogenase [FAD, quinone]-like [Maniola hyperantus]|uniref:glucose dehydrogenase [FAD, quinone]-like n=1 Tax=Aphantopus hyperantus TaxID=2795564 RepID=UPI0015685892|nr:glucose dehydrogenase [FAD, quinone]-like [Maniola hyperantus]
MIWQPLNITEVCPPYTPISACSNFGLVYLSLLVQLYGGSADKRRQAMCEMEGQKSRRHKEYDFIVVGAGSAGCVVANRLTENPKWKVLLLEAGPEEPDVTLVPGLSTAVLGSNIDWRYSTEPNGKSCLAHPGGRCAWPRGKTMGGSSSINSLAYIRGNRADYDEWASMGNEGWSYEEVLPFFRKSERNLNIEVLNSKYHGAKGEQYVSRYPYIDKPSLMLTAGFNQGGLPLVDYNGAHQLGTMQAQAVSLDGERVSTNIAFIQPIRNKRPNLDIETNSEATKILIDESKHAYGIVYVKNGKKYTAYAKKEVILSAGSINSPKLLMLSGIGPKDHLESLGIPVVQDLPVGENLHDHVTFSGMILALSNKTATTVSEEEILRAVEDYAQMKFKRGPLSGNGPVNSVSFLKTDADLIAPNVQFQVNSIPNWREFIQDPVTAENVAIMPTSFYDAVLPRPMNLVPRSRGVLLLNETDPNGHPLLYANYFGDERDFVPLLKAIRFLLSLEDTVAFRSHGAHFVREPLPYCKNYEWGTDEYFICLMQAYTSTTYHPVGTCRMGPQGDRRAVLDNQLRVHGVDALRVIDASMMPVVVRGNTNAPTIMIGERGVDFVIRYWRGRTQNYC